MSNVQITKRRGNVTTVNPLLICEEVHLIFRWLEVVRSLPQGGYSGVLVTARCEALF